MAGLNKLQLGVWGRKLDYVPNIIFEGIGSVITTKEDLEPLLTLTGSIKTFEIINNNVFCYITGTVSFPDNAFRVGYHGFTSGNHIKGLYDLNGCVTDLGLSSSNSFSFYDCGNFNRQNTYNVNTIGRQSTQRCYFDVFYLPELTHAYQRVFGAFGNVPFNYLYAPKLTTISGSFENTTYAGKYAFLNPYLQTNNGGGVDAEVASFISKGGTVVWVTDTANKPDNINDLSASDITATSCKLNFTPPSSVNPLFRYEVWIDDGTSNPRQLYSHHQVKSASGQTVTGLISGKTYKIKIAACDSFYNGSGYADYRNESSWSNEIIVTTL